MPRHLIKRYSPDHEKIRNHKHVKVFGKLLHDPNLWHLNRRSVSGAFGVGLFWAMIPMPFQMIAAAATAIGLRTNLPLSVVLVGAVCIGAVLGMLAGLAGLASLKHENANLRRAARLASEEVKNLRTMPIKDD